MNSSFTIAAGSADTTETLTINITNPSAGIIKDITEQNPHATAGGRTHLMGALLPSALICAGLGAYADAGINGTALKRSPNAYAEAYRQIAEWPQRKRIEPVSGAGTSLGKFELSLESQTAENPAAVLKALRDLSAFQSDNWDAEGARGITQEMIGAAVRLLASLPAAAALPDIAPARDGSLCMEWESAVGTLWLDIGADRTVQVLLETSTFTDEKRFRADDPNVAAYLRVAAENLYPAKHEPAVRSVMVPA